MGFKNYFCVEKRSNIWYNRVRIKGRCFYMKIKDKINMDSNGLANNGAINIVAFGDSITHGAFGPGDIDYEAVYWNLLKRKIESVRKYVPVNVINSGIGGLTAEGSLARLERDVLFHHPDLVIVCFGLNDVNGPLENYVAALKVIFERCRDTGAEVIFMTPNMLNTYVADDADPAFLDYAAVTAEMQNGGKFDKYISAACDAALICGVTVCDCYAEWKKLYNEGVDTTTLLANRINHPTKQMHHLFADKLFETIFGSENTASAPEESTMYRG